MELKGSLDKTLKTLNKYPDIDIATFFSVIRKGLSELKKYNEKVENPKFREGWDVGLLQFTYNIDVESIENISKEDGEGIYITTIKTKDPGAILAKEITNFVGHHYRVRGKKALDFTVSPLLIKQDAGFDTLSPNKKQQSIKNRIKKHFTAPSSTLRHTIVTEEFAGTVKDDKDEPKKIKARLTLHFEPLTIVEHKNNTKGYYILTIGIGMEGFMPVHWQEKDKAEFWEILDKILLDEQPQGSLGFLQDSTKEPEIIPVSKDRKYFKMGNYGLAQFLGGQKTLTQFNKDNITKTYQSSSGSNTDLLQKIAGYGVPSSFTELEFRVIEAILKAFSDTNYKGNMPAKSIMEVVGDSSDGFGTPAPFKNLREIPIIKQTKTDILKRANLDPNNGANIQRITDILENKLPTWLLCFYWTRLARDENGTPLKDHRGNWKKEDVSMVDFPLKVKTVRDLETGSFKYYEIQPSPVFLDEVDSYFVCIPYNLREDIKAVSGKNTISSYTYKLMLEIIRRYEYIRNYNQRHKDKKLYKISLSYKDLTNILKMPPSLVTTKKDRVYKIFDETYDIAKKMNYLNSFKRDNDIEILTLNPEGFYNPSRLNQNN